MKYDGNECIAIGLWVKVELRLTRALMLLQLNYYHQHSGTIADPFASDRVQKDAMFLRRDMLSKMERCDKAEGVSHGCCLL